MKVNVLHYLKGIAYGNIMYLEKDDPCKDNPEPLTWEGMQPKMGDDILSDFRRAGYHASCFPEGDGIAFKPLRGQSYDQIEKDVRDILKFEIVQVKNRS
jgi:hypothetical protein